MSFTLPEEVVAYVGASPRIEHPFQGMAYETSILLSERGKFVFKIARQDLTIRQLEDEYRILHSLGAEPPPVPRPLISVRRDGTAIALLSYLDGENLVEATVDADVTRRHTLVGAYALALRRVHTWQPNVATAPDWLDSVVARIRTDVARGCTPPLIPYISPFNGWTADDVLSEIEEELPTVEDDIVFCHGDYCLPNVLVSEGVISGVVDWSSGGYADRRIDLATAAWSIRRNLEDESYVNTFLRTYGYAGGAKSLRFFEALYALM